MKLIGRSALLINWKKLARSLLFIGVGVFFLFGILFRVFLSEKLSFTYDEMWAFHFAHQEHSIWEHIVHPFDDRPPVHYILLKLQSSISQSILWLRFPSILCSAAVLLCAAMVTRKVSYRFAIAVILFGTMSYSSVRYATLARDYGFIVLAAWLQVHSIWKWIAPKTSSVKENLSWAQIVEWSLAAFFGVGLNYVYIPFLVSLITGLFVAMLGEYRLKQISVQVVFKRIGVLLAATLPTVVMVGYYLIGYNQFSIIMSTTDWIRQPNLREVLDLLTIHFGLGTYVNWSGLVFGFAIICVGIYISWRDRLNRTFMVFSLITISSNISGLVIISLLGSSFFLIRYFAPLSVVSLLFVSFIGWKLWELADRPIRIFMLAWFFIGYVPYMVLEMNNRLGFFGSLEKYGTEYTQLVQTIKKEWRPGDQLIFSPKSYGVLYRDFYFNSPLYASSAEIAAQIDPIDIFACEKRKKMVFSEGTKLVVAVVSQVAYTQPESILISETTTNIYPDYVLSLDELCETEPINVLKVNQTGVWTCMLKHEIRLTQYCYLP